MPGSQPDDDNADQQDVSKNENEFNQDNGEIIDQLDLEVKSDSQKDLISENEKNNHIQNDNQRVENRSRSRSRSRSASRRPDDKVGVSRSRSRSKSVSRSRSRSREPYNKHKSNGNADASRRSTGGPGFGSAYRSMSLLVRNLSYETTTTDLRDEFSRYGELKDVYMPQDYYTRKPKGYAFIEFSNEEDAEDALREMHGRKFLDRVLEVVMAKQRRKSPDEMRRFDSKKGSSRSRNDSYRDRDDRGERSDYRDRDYDRDHERDRGYKRRRDDYRSRSRSRDYDRSYRESGRSRYYSRSRSR